MNDFGAPTKYRDDYPERALAYFTREAYQPLMHKGQPVVNPKTGEIELVTSDFPTLEGLGVHLNVWATTIDKWREKYPDFDIAIRNGKKRAKAQLIQGGLQGRYHPTFSIFVAKNCTDMRDKRETEVAGKLTIEKILAEIDGGV